MSATLLVVTSSSIAFLGVRSAWLQSSHFNSCARSRPIDAIDSKPAIREQAALAFGAALTSAWAGSPADLVELLHPDARVETPMWSCGSRKEYTSELMDAQSFFSPLSQPSMLVISHKVLGDDRAQVSWMLGVEWPAAWRPRVSILGQSTLKFKSQGDGANRPCICSIEESWHQSPNEAFFSQVLPRPRDILSLWASPTAETFPLQVVSKRKMYELIRLPPMIALQAECTVVGVSAP